MDALHDLLTTNGIQIACSDLKKLLTLYTTDTNFDKNVAATLISATLANTTLPMPAREENINIILTMWNTIKDPLLISIIEKHIDVLFTSILASDLVPTFVRMRHARLISNCIKNDSFSIVPTITNFACEEFKKSGRMPYGILQLIIKSPQSIGGTIINTILKLINHHNSENTSVICFTPKTDVEKTKPIPKSKFKKENKFFNLDSNDEEEEESGEYSSGSELTCSSNDSCDSILDSILDSDSSIDKDEVVEIRKVINHITNNSLLPRSENVTIDVTINTAKVNDSINTAKVNDSIDISISLDDNSDTTKSDAEEVNDDNNYQDSQDSQDSQELTNTNTYASLVTQINKKIDPEIIYKFVENKEEPISVRYNNAQLVEILFNDICNAIISQYKYTGKSKSKNKGKNKQEKINSFTDEYDEITSPFVNNSLLQPSRLLAVFNNIYKNNRFKQSPQFVEQIVKNCDESVMQQMASYVPEMYKLLFENPIDLKSQMKKMEKYPINPANTPKNHNISSNIGVFAEIMRLTAHYMDSVTINNIIMVVHGIVDLESVSETTSVNQTFSLKLVSAKNKPDKPGKYDKNKQKSLKMSENLLNIEAIEIVNMYFPLQLMTLIQSRLFQDGICIFGAPRKYGYSRSVKKALITYTHILNSWGYLPYDTLSEKHMCLSENNIPCALCLHDTKWIFKKCKHSICRRCFISNAYTKKNIIRYSREIVFSECVTCDTLNKLKDRKGGKMRDLSDSEDSDD